MFSTESDQPTKRPRGVWYALSAIILTIGASLGSFVVLGSISATAANGPDAVSGSAFGLSLSLLGTSLVPPTPTVTLPADGTAQTNSIVNIPANPLVTSVVAGVNTSATNATQATEVVHSSADTANPALVNALVPAIVSLLAVDAVHTVCTSSATGSTGGTTVVNLVVGGTAVPVPQGIDQVLTLPAALSPLLSIEVNKQVVTNSIGATGITVDGLVVTVASAVAGGGVITLAESKCGATGPDINAVPTVTGINPNSGPTTGGTTVTITGTGFNCVSGVSFGSTGATFTVVSPTQITATSPAGSAGTVDVTVKNCNGTSPTGTADQFTYVATAGVPTAPAAPLSKPVAVTG